MNKRILWPVLFVVSLARLGHAEECNPNLAATNLGIILAPPAQKPPMCVVPKQTAENSNWNYVQQMTGPFFSLGVPLSPLDNISIVDGKALTCGTATGCNLMSATNQKFAFWGATPASQSGAGCGANANIKACLLGLGIISGTSNSLNVENGNVTAATATFGTTTIVDGNNVVLGSTTGTKIGTATSQKLGFFNAAPVVQQSASNALTTSLGILGLVALPGAGASTSVGPTPAVQDFTVGAGAQTLNADACGSTKRVSASGGAATNVTLATPAATNTGCVMAVCNTTAGGAITLTHTGFLNTTGSTLVLAVNTCLLVSSDGTTWRQLTAPTAALS